MVLGRMTLSNTVPISKPLGQISDGIPTFRPPRSYSLGEETFNRYSHLVVGTGNLPFVRASGSKRVISSAQSWVKGEPHALCTPRQLR